jgi:hypothetical protein
MQKIEDKKDTKKKKALNETCRKAAKFYFLKIVFIFVV